MRTALRQKLQKLLSFRLTMMLLAIPECQMRDFCAPVQLGKFCRFSRKTRQLEAGTNSHPLFAKLLIVD